MLSLVMQRSWCARSSGLSARQPFAGDALGRQMRRGRPAGSSFGRERNPAIAGIGDQ